MFFSLFLYGIIYWIFRNIPLEIVRGKGLKWYEYVRNGGGGLVACARVRTMGEGGTNFCHVGAYVLIERP